MADFDEVTAAVLRAAEHVLAALNDNHPDAGWRWRYSDNLRPELLQIPEYKEFLRTSQTNPLLNKHLGKFIGSSIQASWYSDASIFIDLLRRAYDAETTSIVHDHLIAALDKLYNFVSNDKIKAELIIPLYGLHLQEGPFQIGVHTSLTESAEEWNKYDEYLQKHHPLKGDKPSAYLRMEYDISKSIHAPDEPPNYQSPNADSDWKQRGDLEERADMALSALKAVLPGALAHGSMVHQYYDWNGHGGHVWTETTPLQFADQDFGPNEFQTFVLFWQKLEGCATKHRQIRIAISRLRFATERQMEEDKTIDLLIAAEALFLSDTGQDKGELGNRIAIRTGKLIGKTNIEQREIYNNMKQIYGFRSAIVHGARPRVPKAFTSHVQLNGLVESYMRAAIRKIVSIHPTEMVFESQFWDDLMFGS